MESYDYTIKVILLGDYGVGKTKLLTSFVHKPGPLPDTNPGCCCPVPRPGGYTDIKLCRNNRNILVKLTDTGGQERYRSLTASYYRGAHGCVIMYDVTSEVTFENVRTWFDDLDIYGSQGMPTILVGAKCASENRQVTPERGEKFAEHMNVPFMEIDSEKNHNVTNLLDSIVDLVIDRVSQSADLQQPISVSLNSPQTHSKSCCRC